MKYVDDIGRRNLLMQPAPTDVSERDSHAQAADLQEKVRFLRHPAHYPHRPDSVEPIETHMSWVFLAGSFVYKFKKPVRYGPIDFSTLEKRHRVCSDELRLNRRFAPETYRGLVPLRREETAGLSIDGPGEVAEWMVLMRRLPERYFLDRMMAAGDVEESDLERAALSLARFYRNASPWEGTPGEYVNLLRTQLRTNRRALREARDTLAPERAEPVVAALDRALGDRKNFLRKRARRRRIVEGHGDLRPQHVCLRPRPVFFDCLEFDRSLRLLDPVDEIAYLAMECEYRGTPRVGEIFYETYAEVTGDEVDPDLAAFYKAHRALVRARLALRHRTVPGGGSRKEWGERAATYVSLAGTYAEQLG